MFESVCYGQTVFGTEVQQWSLTWDQIRLAVPLNHAPPGLTVNVKMQIIVYHIIAYYLI